MRDLEGCEDVQDPARLRTAVSRGSEHVAETSLDDQRRVRRFREISEGEVQLTADGCLREIRWGLALHCRDNDVVANDRVVADWQAAPVNRDITAGKAPWKPLGDVYRDLERSLEPSRLGHPEPWSSSVHRGLRAPEDQLAPGLVSGPDKERASRSRPAEREVDRLADSPACFYWHLLDDIRRVR